MARLQHLPVACGSGQGALQSKRESFIIVGEQLPFVRAHGFSGRELRRLSELREMVKVESVRLPPALLRELLVLLEGARPWQIPPAPVPEMTRAELLRAIRWRLGTIAPAGAEAAAAFVVRHRRRRVPGAGSRRRTP